MHKELYFKHSSRYINLLPSEQLSSLAENASDYATIYNFSPIRNNIVSWCDLGNKILEIGGELGAITGSLLQKGSVTSFERNPEYAALLKRRHPSANVVTSLNGITEKFDSILLIGSLSEYSEGDEVGFIRSLSDMLSEGGKLFIATDNSLAIGKLSGRISSDYFDNGYSKSQIINFLKSANLSYSSFLYPAPDYRFTNVIFSDDHMPDIESIKRRLIYSPELPVSSFNENEYLRRFIDSEPDAFPYIADSFMVVASRDKTPSTPKLVCFSVYRKKEYMISTVVGDTYAVKSAVSQDSQAHLQSIGSNISILSDKGIEILDSYGNNIVTSKICNGKTFDQILLETYKNEGISSFLKLGNNFFSTVEKSCGKGKDTDTIFERFGIEISDEIRSKLHFLEHGFMDMIFQNCFFENGKLSFYDQEWMYKNTPLEYIIFRALTNSEAITQNVSEDLFELFGISQFVEIFYDLNRAFSDEVYSTLYKNWYAVNYRTYKDFIADLAETKEASSAEKKVLSDNLAAKHNLINELQRDIHILRTSGIRYKCGLFLRNHPRLHKTLKLAFSPYNYIKCKRIQNAKPKSIAQEVVDSYKDWLTANLPTPQELEAQRKHSFKITPKFSILVPLYNTDKKMLVEMIDSVRSQTYSEWELCLADASDKEHRYVEKTVMELAASDGRIKYHRLENNLGIALNTNACADIATGDYIALLDHDDALAPNALYEMACVINETPEADFIYTDEDKFSDDITNRYDPHFKPDFSVYTLRSFNYICHFTALKTELFNEIGRYVSGYDGAQDYDLFLRASEKANSIKHIAKPLYHWRVHPASTASAAGSKNYAEEAGRLAVKAHLDRLGIKGEASNTGLPFRYRVKYPLSDSPLVSILIPNKDSLDDLKKCVNSILNSTYTNYEIIIIENNSVTDEIFDYYNELSGNPRIKIVCYTEKGFNYSKINNFGAKHANGEYILLLNNDIESINDDWLAEMVSIALQKDVCAVGARLLYPDDTVQHSGVVIGMGGVAGHIEKLIPDTSDGYFGYSRSIRELSSVTAACLIVRKSDFDDVGGLDEGFAVAFNDIDFCLKLKKNGGKIIYTPYATMHHYESKSRGAEDSPEKIARFQSEISRFNSKWGDILQSGDPFFNKNLRLDSNYYLPRTDKVL